MVKCSLMLHLFTVIFCNVMTNRKQRKGRAEGRPTAVEVMLLKIHSAAEPRSAGASAASPYHQQQPTQLSMQRQGICVYMCVFVCVCVCVREI